MVRIIVILSNKKHNDVLTTLLTYIYLYLCTFKISYLKNMEECDHRKQMPQLQAKENRYFFGKSRGITQECKIILILKQDKNTSQNKRGHVGLVVDHI